LRRCSVVRRGPAARLQAPPILTGRDLIDRFGLEPGPLIGDILRKVEDARLEGLVFDRDSALEVAAALLRTGVKVSG